MRLRSEKSEYLGSKMGKVFFNMQDQMYWHTVFKSIVFVMADGIVNENPNPSVILGRME